MLWDTAFQWQVFLMMTAAGVLAGGLYDLIWLLRIRLEAGFWLSLAADMLFGAGAAAIFIAFSMQACYGQVRFFQMCAYAIGFALYRGGPHKILRGAAMAVAKRLSGLAKNQWLQKIFR